MKQTENSYGSISTARTSFYSGWNDWAVPDKVFPLTEGFTEQKPDFITEDEINTEVSRGGSYSDSRLAAYVFFHNHTDRKERQDYLKNAFGIGGGGYMEKDVWHDGKGLRIKRTYHKEYAKEFLNWNQVERRMNQLIDSDRLLFPEDKAKFPEYERYVLSRNVDTLFAYAPELRPYVAEMFWRRLEKSPPDAGRYRKDRYAALCDGREVTVHVPLRSWV